MAFFQDLHYAFERTGIKGHDTCTGRIQFIRNTNIGHFCLNKACLKFAIVLGTYIPVQKHPPLHLHMHIQEGCVLGLHVLQEISLRYY